jgi:hypothetical protein
MFPMHWVWRWCNPDRPGPDPHPNCQVQGWHNSHLTLYGRFWFATYRLHKGRL